MTRAASRYASSTAELDEQYTQTDIPTTHLHTAGLNAAGAQYIVIPRYVRKQSGCPETRH
jgi:hypothetical protein